MNASIALVVLFAFLVLCSLTIFLAAPSAFRNVVGGAAVAKMRGKTAKPPKKSTRAAKPVKKGDKAVKTASKRGVKRSTKATKPVKKARKLARPAHAPRVVDHSVVVDTLNLLHWGRDPTRRSSPVTTREIAAAIGRAAPVLRKAYPGRVYFVVKTRDGSDPSDTASAESVRQEYAKIARAHRVFISLVERLSDPPSSAKNAHPQVGRDDFYIAVLADRYKCAALSRDHFRDLSAMKAEGLEAFHVWTFSPFGSAPARDFVRPSVGFRKLRRPPRVDFGDVPGLPGAFDVSVLPGG